MWKQRVVEAVGLRLDLDLAEHRVVHTVSYHYQPPPLLLFNRTVVILYSVVCTVI
jgi:hypothetical protein